MAGAADGGALGMNEPITATEVERRIKEHFSQSATKKALDQAFKECTVFGNALAALKRHGFIKDKK
jgi:hypothetical protein